jgi:hypothetical protein
VVIVVVDVVAVIVVTVASPPGPEVNCACFGCGWLGFGVRFVVIVHS